MSSWSIDHISAVTLAVREMAESVAFYQKLGLDVSYRGTRCVALDPGVHATGR